MESTFGLQGRSSATTRKELRFQSRNFLVVPQQSRGSGGIQVSVRTRTLLLVLVRCIISIVLVGRIESRQPVKRLHPQGSHHEKHVASPGSRSGSKTRGRRLHIRREIRPY